MNTQLSEAFGNIDIYLFDQLLKGNFDHCDRVLDVGCGGGRNIIYFLKNGYKVHGIDQDEEAIRKVRDLAKQLAPGNAGGNFTVGNAEELPYPTGSFDLVICSAVLHFANDKAHFEAILSSMWRVLQPEGILFARLASDIGIETMVKSVGNGRYLLPDGSERFLVNHGMLLAYTHDLNGELYEPIKTTNVSNIRCMTTWCLRKK